MEFKDIIEIFTRIYNNEKNFFLGIQEFDKNSDAKYCLLIIIISMYLVIIFAIYEFNIMKFISYLKNLFLNSLRINSPLINYPEYAQISNLFYINNNISFNISALIYFKFLFIIILTIIYIMYAYSDFYENEPMTYITIWSSIGAFLMLIYLFINYNATVNLSNKNNLMMNLLYSHINFEYLDKSNICNYFNAPESNSNKSFISGKCNDLNYHNSILYSYIKKIIGEITSTYSIDIANVTLDEFKTYVDANGISYYNKIIDIIFTNTLLNYFIRNNLINEAEEFFSDDNLNNKNTNFLTKFLYGGQINPINYIIFNDLSILESNYKYDNFKLIMPKILFYNIIQDYNKLQDNVSNLIIDIINICQYKLQPPDYYYNYITFLLIIMLIVYIISNSK